MPAPKRLAAKYLDGENVRWQKDTKGSAGILTISAPTEPGVLEELWDVDNYLDRVVGVRQQLIDGDLRPLYVAWLCGCQGYEVDPEAAVEPPVPAGLSKPTTALAALLELFDLSPFVLAAAAEQSPPPSPRSDPNAGLAEWLASADPATLRHWVLRFLNDEPAAVKADCLRAFRKANPPSAWPTVDGTRSFAQLLARAGELAEVEREREKKRQQRAHQKRLAEMAKAPQKYLDEVDRHVARRGREHYEQAAQLLNDIRTAVGGKKGEDIVRTHAAALKQRHPTLRLLSAALRRQGFI